MAITHGLFRFRRGSVPGPRLHRGFKSAGREHPLEVALVLEFTDLQLRLEPTSPRLTAEQLVGS